MSDACPICRSSSGVAIESRERVPVLLNRVYATRGEAQAAPVGRLDILHCGDCGFAWNAAFDASLIVYDDSYENDQTHSPAFSAHLEARVADVLSALPAGEAIDYLEIGCGQGGFIGAVARAAGPRLRSAEGFDPAWRGADGDGPGGSRIHIAYFNAGTAGRLRHRPNIVVSRHTIEHVQNPAAFLSSIRRALGTDSRARLFIETPSIDWILARRAMQDLFYEHCSIFSVAALSYALETSGFRVDRVGEVFGGQYLWAEAQAAAPVQPTPPSRVGRPISGGGPADYVSHWRRIVEEARLAGPVAVWGAGAKGVTFCGLVDPAGAVIDHVIDVNPAKQRLHLAGTGLQVLSPADARARAPGLILVMNSNYLAEVARQAAAAGLKSRLMAID